MWISKKQYDRIMERIGDLERASHGDYDGRKYLSLEHKGLRSELADLRDHFRVLVESLGLVHHKTPPKEQYIKKGGPERVE